MARTSAVARKFAMDVLEDPIYQAKLKARANLGILPPGVETMLWHYAYGKPPDVVDMQVTDVTAAKLQEMSDEELAAHMEQMRQAFLEQAKNAARNAIVHTQTATDEDTSLMQDPPPLDGNVLQFRPH